MAAEGTPLQRFWLFNGFTVGVGFTVMVKFAGTPGQPFNDGTMVTTAVIVAPLLLVAVNEGMFPVPDAPRPMAVLLLLHEKMVPATGPDNTVADAVAPLQ